MATRRARPVDGVAYRSERKPTRCEMNELDALVHDRMVYRRCKLKPGHKGKHKFGPWGAWRSKGPRTDRYFVGLVVRRCIEEQKDSIVDYSLNVYRECKLKMGHRGKHKFGPWKVADNGR